jgi:ppGpp synthetase/RelA/SpoT-type nucleotidyltranferase
MDIIDDFMARYVKEYDFYDKASQIVARTLDQDLQEAGVRCIITSRAKSPIRLEAKCRQRNAKNAYSSVDQIYDDIVDLAGARVALYFPLQRTLVGNRIESLFHVLRTKTFPEEPREQNRDPRFVGYVATHYHVRLHEDDLAEIDKRFATARVEIQIASVLMHGWAEVDHDLVYKPQSEALSVEEYAILNQLNGLVTTGEAMLESLQRLGEERIADRKRRFSNHYDLAAYLLSQPNIASESPTISASGLGRVDLLFEFLAELDMATPEQLEPYLEALHGNLESRPLAQQVVDALTAEDSERYRVYQNVRLGRHASEPEPYEFNQLVGRFLSSWIDLEQLERELVPPMETRKRALPTGRALEQAGYLEGDTRRELDFIRKMRNQLVHGIEIPSATELAEAADQLDLIVAGIHSRIRTD